MQLCESDIHVAFRVVSELLDRRRLQGIGVPPWMDEHKRRMESRYLSMLASASGTEKSGDTSQSDEDDLIGTKEAAAILGISTRRVRDIAADLDGTRPGRDWMFRRRVVEDYSEGRQRR